jgi:hypothetical protein
MEGTHVIGEPGGVMTAPGAQNAPRPHHSAGLLQSDLTPSPADGTKTSQAMEVPVMRLSPAVVQKPPLSSVQELQMMTDKYK